MSRRGWCAIAAVGALVGLGAGLAIPPADAQDSGFGSYTISASAQGVGAIVAGRIDVGAPDATATYSTGDVGYARAANLWPGSIAANLGDALPLLLGRFPPELTPIRPLLSYPVRTEARAPDGPADVTFDAIPGLTMRSTAVQGGAVSSAHVQRVDSEQVGAVATVRTDTSARLAGDHVVAEAVSSVADLDLVGGLLHLGSVTSRAVATSDGSTGTARGATTVAGVTVLGVPATIDDRGLTIGTASNPIDEALSAALTQAVSSAGIRVIVGQDVEEVQGRTAKAGAGAVLITMDAGGTPIGITLGGASASATASVLDASAAADVDVPLPEIGDGGGLGVGGGTPLALGGAADAPSVGRTPAGPGSAPSTPISVLASATPPGLAALGAVVALLAGLALRRLSDRLFDTASSCPSGGPT